MDFEMCYTGYDRDAVEGIIPNKKSMQTKFLFQNVSLQEKTMQYMTKRLERLEKLVDPVSKLEVEVDVDKKGKFRVEIMIREPKNKLFRAEETTESVEGSTDIAVDDIIRQITDEKDKSKSLTRRGARSIKKSTTIDETARF